MSTAQVSNRVGIVFDMQSELDRSDLVRCLNCHAVYDQTAAPTRAEETATCPECGDVAWLHASIPVEETVAAIPA